MQTLSFSPFLNPVKLQLKPALKRYEDLLKAVDTADREDLYSALMGKERDTLEVVNRVANSKQQSQAKFYEASVPALAKSALGAAQTVADIAAGKGKWEDLVSSNERMFAMGLLAVVAGALGLTLKSVFL